MTDPRVTAPDAFSDVSIDPTPHRAATVATPRPGDDGWLEAMRALVGEPAARPAAGVRDTASPEIFEDVFDDRDFDGFDRDADGHQGRDADDDRSPDSRLAGLAEADTPPAWMSTAATAVRDDVARPETGARAPMIATTVAAAPGEATAAIAPNFIPGDGGLSSQWHILNTAHPGIDLNVTPAWDDYRGDGVLVGVLDTGVDYTHPDIAPNYRADKDHDARDTDADAFASQSDDKHGTAVMGVVGSAIGGGDTVGVAPEADLAGYRVGFGPFDSSTQIYFGLNAALANDVDVLNNSWSFETPYADNIVASSYFALLVGRVEALATSGRDGLGTVVTFAAGNDRGAGSDSNMHNFQNSRFAISVAAIEADGDISSFSNPGAPNLVSAPGSGIYTTDHTSGGYNGGDYVSINGTSFSAPAVAGVAALILDANPDLGYRDVQAILALSALNPKPSSGGWQTNGATTWNGGGMTFSHDHGFGLVDALAATRLAETWLATGDSARTAANEASLATGTVTVGQPIPNGSGALTRTVSMNGDVDVEHIEVRVDITHPHIGDLVITLTAPDGTVSTLVDRPQNGAYPLDNLNFQLATVAHWGTNSAGTWTLAVQDANANGSGGTLNNFSISLHGSQASSDDMYVFTNSWAAMAAAEPQRATIDGGDGDDTANFAAVGGDVTAALDGGPSTIDGVGFTLNDIEHAIGGDGDDTFTGDASANTLSGMRGDDVLKGGGGDDLLRGGDGLDIAVFDGARSQYQLGLDQDTGMATVLHSGGDGLDSLDDMELLQFADVVTDTHGNVFDNVVTGTDGDDDLTGAAGNDYLSGGAGDDILFGGAGSDLFVFLRGAGSDAVEDFETNADRVDVSDFGYGNETEVFADATQSGADVIIQLGDSGGDQVILMGINLNDLSDNDFLI